MVQNIDETENAGRVISDIVKEYPDMLKIVIYHNDYVLPRVDRVLQQQRKDYTKKQKDEMNLHRSLRRTKTTIQDIMLSNRFDYWCTFTYNCRNCLPKCTNDPCTCSPSTCKRYDMHYTNVTLRNWFRNQRKHSPDLRYLAVPEFHKNGAIHFHCMISGFNGRLKDSGKKTKYRQTVYNASGYYSGWTEFVRIGERFDSENFEEDYKRVSSYLTKYVTKDMPLIYGKRRFLVSEGLQRPVTHVNGVFKYALRGMIQNYKPEYINSFLEVQKHHKQPGIPLVRDYQGELF